MASSTRVYEPIAPCHNEAQPLRRTLDALNGKTVGFIDNGKPNFHYLVDDLAELLVSEHGVAAVIKRRKDRPGVAAPEAMLRALSEQCDAVVTGLGD